MSLDLWAILLAAGGAILSVGLAWIKGRASGRNAVIVEQVKKDERTREQFDRIDRQSPDVDVALDRLRKRAKSGDADAK